MAIEELCYNIERITEEGVKLARFDKIKYGGPLFDEEEQGLRNITKACEEARVVLFCSPDEYDRFLNNIIMSCPCETFEIAKVIKQLEPGDYHFDGKCTFNPLFLCTLVDGIYVPLDFSELNGEKLYKLSLMFVDEDETNHTKVKRLKDIKAAMREHKIEFLSSIDTFKYLLDLEDGILVGIMDLINQLDPGDYLLTKEMISPQ